MDVDLFVNEISLCFWSHFDLLFFCTVLLYGSSVRFFYSLWLSCWPHVDLVWDRSFFFHMKAECFRERRESIQGAVTSLKKRCLLALFWPRGLIRVQYLELLQLWIRNRSPRNLVYRELLSRAWFATDLLHWIKNINNVRAVVHLCPRRFCFCSGSFIFFCCFRTLPLKSLRDRRQSCSAAGVKPPSNNFAAQSFMTGSKLLAWCRLSYLMINVWSLWTIFWWPTQQSSLFYIRRFEVSGHVTCFLVKHDLNPHKKIKHNM